MTLKPRRGKSYFASGLWERKHREKMGQAIWLFGWLVDRQTKQRGTMGLVLRGKPLTYGLIAHSMRESPRTVEGWMATLKRGGYIEVRRTTFSHMVIYINNAKKFGRRQGHFSLDFKSRQFAGHGPASLRDSRNERRRTRRELESQKRIPGETADDLEMTPREIAFRLAQLREARARLEKPEGEGVGPKSCGAAEEATA